MPSAVLVPYGDGWLPGEMLFEYVDAGRHRCLVRYELPGGVVVRRLHWRDQLAPPAVELELPLVPAPRPEPPAPAPSRDRDGTPRPAPGR